jgi:hypothetical protein
MIAFLFSPLGRWFLGVTMVAAVIAGLAGLAHHKGVLSERAKWQAEQVILVAQRNAALVKVNDAESRAAAKDAEINALNRKLIENVPHDTTPALPQSSARRVRNVR